VVAWVQSDSPQVHSENEVVHLLAGEGLGDRRLPLQCRSSWSSLQCTVRSVDRGPTYLNMVAPAPDWFESGPSSIQQVTAQTSRRQQ
jgi:hypothetical protein